MTPTAVRVEAESRYEQFVESERAYFFALATEDERAESVARIIAFLDSHPDIALQTLCKDVAGGEWAALRQRVLRTQEGALSQVDEPEPRTLNTPAPTLKPTAIRQVRSFISRAPDEVVASLSEDQLDALHGAVAERRAIFRTPKVATSEPTQGVDWDKEAAKHECSDCWHHCPSPSGWWAEKKRRQLAQEEEG